MAFANGVVDDFIRRLRVSAEIRIVYREPLLLITVNRIAFAGPKDLRDDNANSTTKAMRGFSIPGHIAASDALEAVSRNEMEFRAELVTLLLNLRHAADDHFPPELNRAIS